MAAAPRRLPLARVASLALALLAPALAALEPAVAPLPDGLGPLPAELDARIAELLRVAEARRGLAAKRPVVSGALDEPALAARMAETFREELPEPELAAVEATLAAFGFIPETLDVGTYLPELLTGQVAGFYDPEREYLAVVLRGGQGQEASPRVAEAVLVHELVHALQDQHFDLEAFEETEPLSDDGVARQALVEGDATLAMLDHLLDRRVEEVPGFEAVLAELLAGSEALAGMDVPGGGAALVGAPLWFRETLLFSYFEGLGFALAARRAGGQKLLDRAFTVDPPRSSEQILHPEKWLGERDDPVEILWPDLSAELPGWRRVATGELGEKDVRVLVRQWGGDADLASRAAGGWGGDRFAVYEKGGRRLLAWITEWDGEADAAEFEAAARRLGHGFKVERSGPRRVNVTRGPLARAERWAVGARLAKAKMVPPENRRIALGEDGEGAGQDARAPRSARGTPETAPPFAL